MTLTCAACRSRLANGEAIVVIDRAEPRRWFTLCRPNVSPGCLAAAGSRQVTAIELLDREAARAYDRQRWRAA